MNTKKQTTAKQTVVHTINAHSICAIIELKASNSGYSFLAYRLERTFTTSTKRTNHSSCFFENNEQEVIETVAAASAWIRANANAALVENRPTEQSAENQ